MCLITFAGFAQQYVDLGLPSGTQWKTTNESGYYTYDQAVAAFGRNLPSKSQLIELNEKCSWEWSGNGYKVIGPNGNSIFLPAAGFYYEDIDYYVGSQGFYVSSSAYDSKDVWFLGFSSSNRWISNLYRIYKRSVRLVR